MIFVVDAIYVYNGILFAQQRCTRIHWQCRLDDNTKYPSANTLTFGWTVYGSGPDGRKRYTLPTLLSVNGWAATLTLSDYVWATIHLTPLERLVAGPQPTFSLYFNPIFCTKHVIWPYIQYVQEIELNAKFVFRGNNNVK